MSQRERTRSESAADAPAREREPRTDQRRRARFDFGAWLLSTAVQTIVVLVGLAVVLFALGQATGVDLLGAVGGALLTHTGQWLAVAFISLLVLGMALRAMRYTRPR
ncbi:uncharacterized protein Nmag_3232 [Natrialba magadii ATCC 43099]|uniref:Uncharacterized protein n=1 Tax=Natrialba magadii (strain ATCC 43099 / DSM 3394 / CCM 3739 / CIP 104546 / IAM 13178 / JCM 8861 / NBRC 102185 / NCIMB 2190 / MS3) TaxID=547559 RepID=D3SS08_NATMM|nr:hypothetical protein [Natrialba magadii]ADD06782.1 uncharacterized protein Nmag_3232 [Natrialba magadii ATCC 43099]ELY27782.1 hypothetical protein C500_14076 [Natrialba magadii ATCC 43099]